jgi:hypothetical protein
MNKFQAMAQIMAILCEDAHLNPKSPVYRIVRQAVSQRIDIFGPDATLARVMDRKPQILNQIKVMIQWQERGRLLPALEF